MNAEEFIKNNPFPPNGSELNLSLVRDIQDPALIADKDRNTTKLLRVNARLIWKIYVQYSYGESLDSVMTFLYEGIHRAAEIYDPKFGMPFYSYAMRITRGMLQNYYNYHNSVIHVPVRKKKEVGLEFSDITEYSDIENTNYSGLVVDDEDDDLFELFELAEKYREKYATEDSIKDLDIILMMRTKTIEEICSTTNLSEAQLKKRLRKMTSKLKTFRDVGK